MRWAATYDDQHRMDIWDLKPAYGAVGDVVGPRDVNQGLASFAPSHGFLALVVRKLWLAAHHYPARLSALTALAGTTADKFTLELCKAS